MALERWMCSLACASMLLAPSPRVARGNSVEAVAREVPSSNETETLPPPTTVTITNTGIAPAALSVYTGTQVAWLNLSDSTRTVSSGAPQMARLPNIRTLPGLSDGVERAGEAVAAVAPSFLGVIPAGGSFSYTFTSPGLNLYFVKERPKLTGSVRVHPWPRIAVQSVAFSPQPVPVSGTLVLTAVVTNSGGDAFPFRVDWQADPQWWPGLPAPYAGAWNLAGLGAGMTAVLTASVVVTQPGGFGVRVAADALDALPEVNKADNVRVSEMGVAGPVEVCGSLADSATWARATYVLACDVTVPPGMTLTLRDNAVLKPKGPGVSLIVLGVLTSTGSAPAPIIVTSYKDDSAGGDSNADGSASAPAAGDWRSVYVAAGGRADVRNTEFRFGGNRYESPIWAEYGQLFTDAGATTEVTDSRMLSGTFGLRARGALTATRVDIRNHTLDGILSEAGTLALFDSQVRGSMGNGVRLQNVPTPVISGTSLLSNTASAILALVGDMPLNTTRVRANTTVGNGVNGITVGWSSLGGDSQWTAQEGMAYVLQGINVAAGATLSVEAGSVLKLIQSADLQVQGTLSLTGSPAKPIILTSDMDDSVGGDSNGDGSATGPSPGDWKSLVVQSGGRAILDHVEMRHGGRAYGSPWWAPLGHIFVSTGGVAWATDTLFISGTLGLRVRGEMTATRVTVRGHQTDAALVESGALVLLDSEIRSNAGHGVRLNNVSTPVISGTAFLSNTNDAIAVFVTDLPFNTQHVRGNRASGNGTNGLVLQGAGLAGHSQWIADPGFPYVLRGLGVGPGATLSVPASTVIKMGVSADLGVQGVLSLTGAPNAPVIITSDDDDSVGGDTHSDGSATSPGPGIWGSIFVSNGGRVWIDHTNMRFGGTWHGSPYWDYLGQVFVDTGGAAELQDSVLVSGTYGLRGRGAVTGTRTVLSNHLTDGIFVESGALTLVDGEVRANGGHGVRLNSVQTPVISGTKFLSNTSDAINAVVWDAPFHTLQVRGNTASGNGRNALVLSNSRLGGTSQWIPDPGFAYLLSGVSVGSDARLDLQAGTVIKVALGSDLGVQGVLSLTGTPAQPVTVTSERDDSVRGDSNGDGISSTPAQGDWGAFTVVAGGRLWTDHAVVRYGGAWHGSPLWDAIGHVFVDTGGAAELRDTAFTTGTYGVRVRGALTATRIALAGHNKDGILVESGGLSLIDSEIRGGSMAGVRLSSVVTPVISGTTFLTNTGSAIAATVWDLPFHTSQVRGNTAIGNGRNALVLASTRLAGASQWIADPGMAYVLEGFSIGSGAVLSVPAGTVLKIAPGNDVGVQGVLSLTGTTAKPVIITSERDDTVAGDTNGDGSATAPIAAEWGALFASSGGRLSADHAIVRFGGSWHGSPLWDNVGQVFADVGSAAELRDTALMTGAYGVRVQGTLTATRLLLSNHFKDGINVEGGALTVLDSEIRTSGMSGVQLSGVSSPVISGTAFVSNTSNALAASVAGLPLHTLQVQGNTASGNGTNALRVSGAQLAGVSQWIANPGFAYVLDGFSIGAGAALTVPPGTVLKIADGSDVGVQGRLGLIGSIGQPVTVTSLHDDSVAGDTNGDGAASAPGAGNWGTVFVSGGGTIRADHAALRYGGTWHGSPYWDALGNVFVDAGGSAELADTSLLNGAYGVRTRGALSLTHSAILSSTQAGLLIESASTARVISSTLAGNVIGVSFSGTLSPTLSGNAIVGNTAWGVQNDAAFTIEARYNWWGSASGPTHASNPAGAGDKVTDRVTFAPFLTAAP